jgi:bacillithiol system protein YtxJ
MDSFLKHNSDSGEFQIDYEVIDVIGNRERSIEIAEQLGIEHESPQLIITDDNNKVVWDGSHRQITEEAVRDALREYTRD